MLVMWVRFFAWQDSTNSPVGRDETDVRSRRFSSTHAWIGRTSRRSEISSRGEAGLWVGTTSLGVEGLAAVDWALAAAFFLGFTAAGLGSAVALDSGFLGLAVLLVAVTVGFLGATVTV
jgi:hypothetical protein